MNFSKLRGRIREVYGTEKAFANAVGISHISLSNRLNNKSKWTLDEIDRTKCLLGINDTDIAAYFFCK